jgi:hypothetical protein
VYLIWANNALIHVFVIARFLYVNIKHECLRKMVNFFSNILFFLRFDEYSTSRNNITTQGQPNSEMPADEHESSVSTTPSSESKSSTTKEKSSSTTEDRTNEAGKDKNEKPHSLTDSNNSTTSKPGPTSESNKPSSTTQKVN